MSAIPRARMNVVTDTLRRYGSWSRIEFEGLTRRDGGVPSGKRLLMLASTFPPVVTGGTYRPLSFARHGSARGWNVVVVGASSDQPTSPAGEHLLERVPSNVRVVRVPPSSPFGHSRLLPPVDGGLDRALDSYEVAHRSVGASRPSVVLASGPPFHQFVAATYLARSFGCRLVLDYRDEWSQCPFDFVRSAWADPWWEARCLRAADLVVFTTESQREHQRKAFPQLARTRCAVIENGWDPEDDSSANSDSSTRTGDEARPVTISFVGTLGSWAEPERFLSNLAVVLQKRPTLRSRLRVQFVGRKGEGVLDAIERFPVPGIVESLAEVPKPTAAEFTRSSTALLLLNPPSLARYVPGKLYEYLASRRPVLVFGEGGESARLVRDLGAGLVVERDDPVALSNALDRLSAGRIRGPSGPAFESWRAAHTREHSASKLFALLEDELLQHTTSCE